MSNHPRIVSALAREMHAAATEANHTPAVAWPDLPQHTQIHYLAVARTLVNNGWCRDPRDIDWRAVDFVVTERHRMPLRRLEQIEVVRRLADKLSADQLGRLLGTTARNIERYKAEIRAEQQEFAAS